MRTRTITQKGIRKTRNFSGKGRGLYILGFKAKSQSGFAEGITNIHVYDTCL